MPKLHVTTLKSGGRKVLKLSIAMPPELEKWREQHTGLGKLFRGRSEAYQVAMLTYIGLHDPEAYEAMTGETPPSVEARDAPAKGRQSK